MNTQEQFMTNLENREEEIPASETTAAVEASTSNEEHVLSDQEKSEIFRIAIEEGIKSAIETVRERFEQSPDEYDRLDFHNVRHTQDVVRRFDTIANLVKDFAPELYNKRSHDIGRLSAAHHDTVQKWEPNAISDQDGLVKIMRKRLVGQNEAESTEGALVLMDKVNEEAGTEIFSESDKAIIKSGHDATVPGFNPEKNTVVQPNLNEGSSVITRAIALADLGTAGMDGPEAYLPEGDALFREENIDIADAVKNLERLTDTKKEFFRKRMLGWSAFQSKFAAGRKNLLETELLSFPVVLREEVRKRFDKFDESIAAAEAQATRRAQLSFEDLALDMGYKLEVMEVEPV